MTQRPASPAPSCSASYPDSWDTQGQPLDSRQAGAKPRGFRTCFAGDTTTTSCPALVFPRTDRTLSPGALGLSPGPPLFLCDIYIVLSLQLSHPPRGLELQPLATKVTIPALFLFAAQAKLHLYCPWFLESTQPFQIQGPALPRVLLLGLQSFCRITGPGKSAH